MKNIGDLVARVTGIQEKARRRTDKEPSVPGKIVQLKIWPDAVRSVPNGVLRSALFGAIRKGPRTYLDQEKIAAVEGVEILYTGQRLDQGDLDVWETLLHLARLKELGSECRFTAYSILKIMEKTDSGKNRTILHKRILRLKANAVEIKQGRYTYIGSLVDDAYKDEETHEYVVTLNSKICPLFATDQFTQVEWKVRHALDGKPLAQWLHGWYASHAKPYPLKIETLHRLCGSEAKRMWDFKVDLQKALGFVADASNTNSQPFSYSIQGDLVHIEKKPSATQQRHLTRRSPNRPRK